MNTATIILYVLLVLGEIACIYVTAHTQAIAKNNAAILKNRKKEYEAEKGKNLATKEDIEEITKKIEEVRTVVTLSNQKKYEVQKEQERMLVEIAEDAIKILITPNKLRNYLLDFTSRERYDRMVDTVFDTFVHFNHLCILAIVSEPFEGIKDVVSNLALEVERMVNQLCAIATEAASQVDKYKICVDVLDDHRLSSEVGDRWKEITREVSQQAEALRTKEISGFDKLEKAIVAYCERLKVAYGKELFIFK